MKRGSRRGGGSDSPVLLCPLPRLNCLSKLMGLAGFHPYTAPLVAPNPTQFSLASRRHTRSPGPSRPWPTHSQRAVMAPGEGGRRVGKAGRKGGTIIPTSILELPISLLTPPSPLALEPSNNPLPPHLRL